MENTVELLGHYGSDEVIACSAWTSTSRNLTDEKRERIPKLINKLWSEGHETPFEKGVVHFLVNCDIASHIHLLKHRISSLNAESARYKELREDKYYLPEDWAGIKESKPEYWKTFNQDINGNEFPFISEEWLKKLENYTNQGNQLYHKCVADLTPVLGRKRAKESARFFKTYNSQIQADVMMNLRSFANFIKLRRSPHSQLEIYEIADKMLNLVRAIDGNPFKHTLSAWELNGIIT